MRIILKNLCWFNRAEGCGLDSVRDRQVLGCSGRGNEVLGFLNFWEIFFLMLDELLVLRRDLLQGGKITSYRVHRI